LADYIGTCLGGMDKKLVVGRLGPLVGLSIVVRDSGDKERLSLLLGGIAGGQRLGRGVHMRMRMRMSMLYRVM
jgi:hypothetical protein